VGPRAVLDAVVKRKTLSRRRKSNPRTAIVQPVAGVLSIVRFMKYKSDQIKEKEMGGTCSTDERRDECLQYFGWKT
jgi:hypothetical protein